jgi:hypothetical protein
MSIRSSCRFAVVQQILRVIRAHASSNSVRPTRTGYKDAIWTPRPTEGGHAVEIGLGWFFRDLPRARTGGLEDKKALLAGRNPCASASPLTTPARRALCSSDHAEPVETRYPLSTYHLGLRDPRRRTCPDGLGSLASRICDPLPP